MQVIQTAESERFDTHFWESVWVENTFYNIISIP